MLDNVKVIYYDAKELADLTAIKTNKIAGGV